MDCLDLVGQLAMVTGPSKDPRYTRLRKDLLLTMHFKRRRAPSRFVHVLASPTTTGFLSRRYSSSDCRSHSRPHSTRLRIYSGMHCTGKVKHCASPNHLELLKNLASFFPPSFLPLLRSFDTPSSRISSCYFFFLSTQPITAAQPRHIAQ